jgi:hypothetical protein
MNRCSRHDDRGVALLAVVYALSIFSVLSLSVLRNPALETLLRTSDHPDLHVVLYTGGAGSAEVIGRLNLPTVLGLEQPVPDVSAEVRVPGAAGWPLMGELEAGLAYAVQIAPELHVCCDGGDGACRNLPWDQRLEEGSVSPALERPLETIQSNRTLRFALSSADIADNVVLDPNAVVDSPFLIRATRTPEGSEPEIVGAASVSCRLLTPGGSVATASARLRPGADAAGQVNRIASGFMELNYRQPAGR